MFQLQEISSVCLTFFATKISFLTHLFDTCLTCATLQFLLKFSVLYCGKHKSTELFTACFMPHMPNNRLLKINLK